MLNKILFESESESELLVNCMDYKRPSYPISLQLNTLMSERFIDSNGIPLHTNAHICACTESGMDL